MNIIVFLMSLISLGDFSSMDQDALVGQEHQVRGFTQCTEDGMWLLSSEPKLHCCCKGSAKKAASQILLPGCSFEKENSLVVMEGTLVANVDNEDVRRFALEEARQIQRQTSTIYFSILAFLLAAVGYLFWKRFASSR